MRLLRALWQHPLQILFLWFLLFSECRARLVNRTIDDSLGDSTTGKRPLYLPAIPGVWQNQTCKTCLVQPDRALAFRGTWTAATYFPDLKNISITLEFSGVAIYVFFILPNDNQNASTIPNTECDFTLDGVSAGSFIHRPDLSTMNLEYNATAFTATGLKNATHQLIISTSHLDYQAFINFDYAIYTFDQPDGISTVSSPSFSTQSEKPQIAASTDNESSHSKINVGAVVGIIVGIFGLFVITISAVAYRRYQKRRRRRARRKILPISVTHRLEGTSASPSSNKRGKSRSPRLDILGNPIMTKGSSFASAPSMPSPSVKIQEQTSAQLEKELTPQRSLQHSPRLATQGSGAETESTVVGVEQRD